MGTRGGLPVGLHLIGFSLLDMVGWIYTALKVGVGLGLVIFVHELGHFLVAKLCGVKCEKFYLGFDIYGVKLLKFQWGETEYGIGVLPLGGYVKMLGQDDNPTRAAEERERAKLHSQAVKHPGDLPAEPTDEEHAPYDPRSYMAQSVPKRMAIISAGVVMNLIFAVIFAAIAYRCGVQYIPCVVGNASPGDPAWTQGIRPGDKIIQFDGEKPSEYLRFDNDLLMNVVLTGASNDLDLMVRRYGADKVEKITVQPSNAHKADTGRVVIGVSPASTTKLGAKPTLSDSPAVKAQPEFEKGDTIVAVSTGGMREPIDDYFQFQQILAQSPEDRLTVFVERTEGEDPSAKPKELQIAVEPNPVRSLGLVMRMGPVAAVQKGSPADLAGFRVGDQIQSVDGQPVADPIGLPDVLRKLADRETTIEVYQESDAPRQTRSLKVRCHRPQNFQVTRPANGPWSSDELGIAYPILNVVQSVDPKGPAADKLQAGDEIVSAEFRADKEEVKKKNTEVGLPDKPILFDADHFNWPHLHSLIQWSVPGTKVELTYLRNKEKKSVVVEPVVAANWFNPERGFSLSMQPLTKIRQTDSWSEAFSLGLRETKESVSMVVLSLRKLASGGVSPTDLGGPGTIAAAAAAHASEGIPRLLIFLTFLSGNLAVINFLPIPILDGGHMMFLLYEGLRGKPASERVMMTLTYLGLVFILTLMIFVLGLDVSRLIKWLFS
jgi:regulator of sigma E protease